jgi:hypothetical protein
MKGKGKYKKTSKQIGKNGLIHYGKESGLPYCIWPDGLAEWQLVFQDSFYPRSLLSNGLTRPEGGSRWAFSNASVFGDELHGLGVPGIPKDGSGM